MNAATEGALLRRGGNARSQGSQHAQHPQHPQHSQRHQRRQRWQRVKRVLAVRLDNLGDVLMTTPALAAIRRSVPEARITLLASPGGAALAPMLRDVDAVLAFEAPWVKHPAARTTGSTAAAAAAERRMVKTLAAERFDAAVVFTVCTQSALPAALWCRLAGIPLRLAHSRENPYGLLTDWVPDDERVESNMRHEVERQLALLAAVGWHADDDRLRLAIDPADRARVAARLAAAGLAPGQAYFVVHPGASAASRRWPAQHFALAAAEIARRSGCVPVFTGSAGTEAQAVAALRATMATPGFSLAGEIGLAELAALIAGAPVLVTNNTGPAHVAAAAGTPVVVLYALTNPQHTPWRVPAHVLFHDVPCRHCLKSTCPLGHNDCLTKVPPRAAVEAAIGLMTLPVLQELYVA